MEDVWITKEQIIDKVRLVDKVNSEVIGLDYLSLFYSVKLLNPHQP